MWGLRLSLKFFFVIPAIAVLSAYTPVNQDYRHDLPPGTILVANNLYYDQTEVDNVNWRVYMYWVGRVFGKNSEEYKASMPDTAVWAKKDACLNHYKNEYLTHSQYDFYPLVGITQKQAFDFAKWRSDRVFERILIDNNVIKEDPTQNRKNYFTIEKYFTGQYQAVKPNPNFRFYPNYRLPNVNEWKIAVHYEDSIEHKYKAKPLPQNTDVVACKQENVTQPSQRQSQDILQSITNKRHPLINLKGNVGEWTSEKDIAIGGGWADKATILSTQDTFHLQTVNAWTGFRCVCEWKEYK